MVDGKAENRIMDMVSPFDRTIFRRGRSPNHPFPAGLRKIRPKFGCFRRLPPRARMHYAK